jgi:hypothetical protein
MNERFNQEIEIIKTQKEMIKPKNSRNQIKT